ncbi:MAG: AraC family transcriptional regulator [Cryomorphaceae bacterium]|nr:AraC family transcriptional regulator [Cryomorphaceae bacterium]
MEYKTYIPAKQLSGLIRFYWSLEGVLPPDGTYIHRTLANHCPELIFHYGGTFREIRTNNSICSTFKTGIHGQTDTIRRFTSKNSCGIFGVMLQPYAVPILFGVSGKAIKNELVDLPLLLGQNGVDISERILQAKDNLSRKRILDKYLQTLLRIERKESPIIHTVHQITRAKGNVNIKNISQQACLSQRQYERRFKELTGFSPKSFSRLVRFKSLVDNYPKRDCSLSEIAYDFGYYDQSHFIQEFKQYSGYNPKAYFDGRAMEVFYSPKQ